MYNLTTKYFFKLICAHKSHSVKTYPNELDTPVPLSLNYVKQVYVSVKSTFIFLEFTYKKLKSISTILRVFIRHIRFVAHLFQ